MFENDLEGAYYFTEKTGRVFTDVFRRDISTSNPIRTKLIESISDKSLTNYYVYLFVEHLKSDTGQFYLEPNFPTNYWVPMVPLRVLIHLPQTAKSKRLLLNYPFEKHGWLWHCHVNGLPDFPDQMPDDAKPNYPKEPLKWYYREIIRGTSLQKKFEQKLRERDLLQSVIEDTQKSSAPNSSD